VAYITEYRRRRSLPHVLIISVIPAHSYCVSGAVHYPFEVQTHYEQKKAALVLKSTALLNVQNLYFCLSTFSVTTPLFCEVEYPGEYL